MCYFDKIDDIEDGILESSMKQTLNINRDVEANKGQIIGLIPLKHNFGFCRTCKKFTEAVGFHLSFKTADIQLFVYKTLGIDITVSSDKLYWYFVSSFQMLLHKACLTKQIIFFTLSFDSWFTDRSAVGTELEYQLDKGSSQDVKSPKYLIAALQTAARMEFPKKAGNVLVSDNLDIRKFFVDFDGVRYPKESVNKKNSANDFIDQYRDLKASYRNCLGKNNYIVSYLILIWKTLILIISETLSFKSTMLIPKKSNYLWNLGELQKRLDCLWF